MYKIKKNIDLVLGIIFILGTITSLFIVYKNIGNKLAIKFVILYVIYILIYLLYLILNAILKLRKLKLIEMKKIGIKFIVKFILLSILLIVFEYVTKCNINYLKVILISFGSALGMTFININIYKK